MIKENKQLNTICESLNLNYKKYANMVYFLNKSNSVVTINKLILILTNKMNNNISNTCDFYSVKTDLLESIKLNPKVMNLTRFKIYYKEKAYKLYSVYCKKKTKNWMPESFDTVSLKFHIKKYGDIIGPLKYKERLEKINTVNIYYWLKQGIPFEEAKILQQERQSTFSLEKCINKYGVKEGDIVFNNRQERWQNTLNNKPQDEIDEMNKLKGITVENMICKYREVEGMKKYNEWKQKLLNRNNFNTKQFVNNIEDCILYYIHFYNTEIEFWKIGITTKQINQRFNFNKIKKECKLEYKIIFLHNDTAHNCFIKEQFILESYNTNRIYIDYNGFYSTECFNKNILCEFVI